MIAIEILNAAALATVTAAWAYLFTGPLTNEDEVFGWWVDRVLIRRFGLDPNFDTSNYPKRWQRILWKWSYCAKCHAGIVSLALGSLFYGLGGVSAVCAVCWVVLSVFFALILSKWLE